MHRSISKSGDSKKFSIEIPKYAHYAMICDKTSCGKTMFVLDLLEFEYKDFFENIVILLSDTLPHHKNGTNHIQIGDGLVA